MFPNISHVGTWRDKAVDIATNQHALTSEQVEELQPTLAAQADEASSFKISGASKLFSISSQLLN